MIRWEEPTTPFLAMPIVRRRFLAPRRGQEYPSSSETRQTKMGGGHSQRVQPNGENVVAIIDLARLKQSGSFDSAEARSGSRVHESTAAGGSLLLRMGRRLGAWLFEGRPEDEQT